jgi:hypothetical protein
MLFQTQLIESHPNFLNSSRYFHLFMKVFAKNLNCRGEEDNMFAKPLVQKRKHQTRHMFFQPKLTKNPPNY